MLYQRRLELLFEVLGFFFASYKLSVHVRHTFSQCVATPSPRWQRFRSLSHETPNRGLQKHTWKRSPTAACKAPNAKQVREKQEFNAKKMRRKCEKIDRPKAYGKIRHFYWENTQLFHFLDFCIFSHFQHFFRIEP